MGKLNIDRNKAWRIFKQNCKVKKRLKESIRPYRYWGYSGDFEYEISFVPRWHDLLGSFYEYRSRTSWSAKKSKWDEKHNRAKSKELNRRGVINELKEFHTGLDQE